MMGPIWRSIGAFPVNRRHSDNLSRDSAPRVAKFSGASTCGIHLYPEISAIASLSALRDEIRVRTESWVAASPPGTGARREHRDRGTRVRLIGRECFGGESAAGWELTFRGWGRTWGCEGVRESQSRAGLYKRAADGSPSQSRINRRWTTHHHPRRYSSAGPLLSANRPPSAPRYVLIFKSVFPFPVF